MPTKIAPHKGAAGHPFTIVDTPTGRLVDGSKAQFRNGSAVVEVDLRTHRPFKTAQGEVPATIGAGVTYNVFIKTPSEEFGVGTFEVPGQATIVQPPTITPTSGSEGDDFKITDPEQRIESGDLALFYPPGDDPANGTLAVGVTVPSSSTLTGKVPAGMAGGVTYHVAVRPSPNDPSRFDDLPFMAT